MLHVSCLVIVSVSQKRMQFEVRCYQLQEQVSREATVKLRHIASVVACALQM